MGISPYRVLAICRRYVELALAATDFSQVKVLANDETSRARGHDYVTLAADAVRRRVLAVTEGRDASCIQAIAVELAERNCPAEQIVSLGIHMSSAFINGCSGPLAHAPDHLRQVPRHQARLRGRRQDAPHRAAR